MPVRILLFLTIVSTFSGVMLGNDIRTGNSTSGNTLTYLQDTLNTTPDSLLVSADSLLNDSSLVDSVAPPQQKTRKSPLADKVTYNAKDSMIIVLTEKKLYLYGEAQVNYQNIELKADYIELDLGDEVVFARGQVDTTGKIIGTPQFKQGDQDFASDSMRYNFNTESGIIYHIITQEGEGYLHSDKTKRHANKHIHLKDGKYTTCDADHPHFYLALTKGIAIPEDKIITGPAYMVVADVPIKFIGVPFGFFPSTNSRQSGILMPTYGDETNRGIFLRDFGWYQVLGDYADASIQGDTYSKGSWAVRSRLSYKWRYHFSGNFNFSYAKTIDNTTDYEGPGLYAVRWTHRQDAKANPNQNFSASVNFTSSEFDKEYSQSSTRYLNSATSSSVSYSRWGNFYNLSLSSNASQNRQTEAVDLNVPTASLNVGTFYPFQKKNGSGSYKWYEKIGINYRADFKNQLNTYQDVLFDNITWQDSLKSGFQHSLPLSVNFNIGKLITITPSVSYKGVVFTGSRTYDPIVEYDSTTNQYIRDTTISDGITYEQAINPSIGISIRPKVYGMLVSTKEDSYVEAIRHVLSPAASFSFTPDMGRFIKTDYYDTLYTINEEGEQVFHEAYSIYDGQLYTPPSSNGKNASLSLSLNNNLEMKVRPRNDTTGESKKVSILDNLNLATGYYPFRDRFKWNDLNMVANTSLFNNKVSISGRGTFSPYGTDSTGAKIDEFYYKQDGGKLLRFQTFGVGISFRLTSRQGKDDDEEETAQDEFSEDQLQYDNYLEGDPDFNRANYMPQSYVDFDVPWSMNVQHNWSFTKSGGGRPPTVVNTVNISGDISFTKNWKFGGSTNIDLDAVKVAHTSISVYRDLHCFDLRITASPFGERTFYSFTIKAKSALLSDLKYEKKPDWYDRF